MLATAEAAVQASRVREDEARAQGRQFADRARRAESQAQEYEADLSQVGF